MLFYTYCSMEEKRKAGRPKGSTKKKVYQTEWLNQREAMQVLGIVNPRTFKDVLNNFDVTTNLIGDRWKYSRRDLIDLRPKASVV